MNIVDVTTENGTHYILDLKDGFWARVRHNSSYLNGTHRLYFLKVGTKLDFPWNIPEAWEDAPVPVVGKHLYVASLNDWYVSSVVTDITEVDDFVGAARRAQEGLQA